MRERLHTSSVYQGTFPLPFGSVDTDISCTYVCVRVCVLESVGKRVISEETEHQRPVRQDRFPVSVLFLTSLSDSGCSTHRQSCHRKRVKQEAKGPGKGAIMGSDMGYKRRWRSGSLRACERGGRTVIKQQACGR